MVAWHGMVDNSNATIRRPPTFFNHVPCRRIVTLKAGALKERIWLDEPPIEGKNEDWREMNSGDELTSWVTDPPFPPGSIHDPISQRWYIDTPDAGKPDVVLVYTREVIRGGA